MSATLRGALNSADETQLEAMLEGGGSLSGDLTDQQGLTGDLTTAITMAAVLAASGSLVAAFTSADLRASLAGSGSIVAAFSTGIALEAQLQAQGSLLGLLVHTPSGDFDPVGRPGDAWRTTPTATRNGVSPTASRNGSAPRMVLP
jgi:hypothetical protein